MGSKGGLLGDRVASKTQARATTGTGPPETMTRHPPKRARENGRRKLCFGHFSRSVFVAFLFCLFLDYVEIPSRFRRNAASDYFLPTSTFRHHYFQVFTHICDLYLDSAALLFSVGFPSRFRRDASSNYFLTTSTFRRHYFQYFSIICDLYLDCGVHYFLTTSSFRRVSVAMHRLTIF